MMRMGELKTEDGPQMSNFIMEIRKIHVIQIEIRGDYDLYSKPDSSMRTVLSSQL